MTTPTNTTTPSVLLRATAGALAFAFCCSAYGQTAAPSSSATADNEPAVELPRFEIMAESGNRYQSQQALSASRVATPIVDIPQTISVISRELMEDTKGNRMLDTAKYVTPVQESTLPFGGDRYTIRGFAVSAEFVDGTNISGADGYSMSQAPYNIERLEVIKGPNAILVPGGSPGGVINPITKAPMPRNVTTATLEFSPDMGRAIAVDTNRVLTKDGKLAARLVAAVWDSKFYIDGHFRKGFEVAPSISYQISANHKLTVKGDIVLNRETNLGGVPLDPTVSSDETARIARGLPRDWMFGNDTDSRKREAQRLSAELLSTYNDHVTSRLFFMADHIWRRDVGGTSAGLPTGTNPGQAGGGSVNPLTGKYEPGVIWNTGAYNSDRTGTVVLQGTPAPVTDPSTWVYTRNNGKVDLEYNEAHLKNDYAFQFAPKYFKSTTIVGLAANVSRVHFLSWPSAGRPSVPANNLGGITFPAYNFPDIQPGANTQARGTNRKASQVDLQTFVYETLSVWDERIQISGGVSRFFGQLSRVDNTQTAVFQSPDILQLSPTYSVTSNATSFGVVVKPIKQVSLFYSRNTTGSSMPGSLNAGAVVPGTPQAVGGQKEYGFKTSFLEGKFTTSFAYFDIAQMNYAVTNSEYYRLLAIGDAVGAASLPLQLLLDLTSKGWEFETTYSLGKSLTILGNITDYKVRQPITDVRLRGVPDMAYGVYADYRFHKGILTGFGVNLGVDHKSKVAGDNATGFTTSRPLPDGTFVATQPSFMIAGRTLVNLGFTYKRENWSAGVTIMNLMDKDYILAAGSRGSVVVGTPRTWKSSVSYTF